MADLKNQSSLFSVSSVPEKQSQRAESVCTPVSINLCSDDVTCSDKPIIGIKYESLFIPFGSIMV